MEEKDFVKSLYKVLKVKGLKIPKYIPSSGELIGYYFVVPEKLPDDKLVKLIEVICAEVDLAISCEGKYKIECYCKYPKEEFYEQERGSIKECFCLLLENIWSTLKEEKQGKIIKILEEMNEDERKKYE